MDKAYNLKIDNFSQNSIIEQNRIIDLSSNINYESSYMRNYDEIEKILSNCISEVNGEFRLNAEALKQLMFPTIKADVFLSHSHADFDLACKVANIIESNTGKNVFIDAVVWKSIYDLEKKLNEKFCVIAETEKYGTLYSHEKVLNIASHVRLLLTTALSSMIKKCSAFVVLNTQSTFIEGALTNSPWIYYEIFQAKQYLKEEKEEGIVLEEKKDVITVDYNVEYYIKSFTEVSISDLCAKL